MGKLASSALRNFGPIIAGLMPRGKRRDGFRRKIYMSKLFKSDRLKWNEETVRDLGVEFGENCRFYSINFFTEPYLVEMGDNVLVSGEVIFVTHDAAVYLFKEDVPDIFGNFGKIRIGSNVFIGMNSIILPNVEIGDNSLVCAGSVVMDSFPPDSVIMGNPAKVVFKTSMYKKMKLSSEYTITNDEYPYPDEMGIPKDLRREIILKHIGHLPVRKPRKR